jgi:plasmid maintenance system killer protein
MSVAIRKLQMLNAATTLNALAAVPGTGWNLSKETAADSTA